MKLRNLTPALLIFLVPCLPAWSSSDESANEVSFEKYVPPLFPYGLIHEGVLEGLVEIAVDINEDGTIADWLVLLATEEKFVTEIERVIDQWIFTPATMDGTTIPIVYKIQFRFSHRGVIVSSGDLTRIYINQITSRGKDARLVFELADLDTVPIPVKVVQPLKIKGLSDEEASGRIVIEFIIDKEGNVRLPVVHEIEGAVELARSANNAVTQWKFEPPIRKGKPVSVRARQPFIFSRGN